MELRHLKYFLTLAEELHFGKAAEKLYISQPPLSRLIKSMENELEVQLFERNNRKVKLTKYGQFLKSEAIKLISRADSIKSHLKLMKNGTLNPIRIGYIASAMYYYLPKVLSELKNKIPLSSTVLIEIDNTSQIKALKTNEIDIGFIRTVEKDRELIFEHIFDEPFTLICSKKHKLSEKKNIDIKDFINDPFVTFTNNCSPMKGIIGILNKNGISPNIVHQTNQINALLRLVENNVGYAIVPSTVIRGFKLKVRIIDLSDYNERTPIYIAYKKTELTEVLKEFIQIIKNYKFLS